MANRAGMIKDLKCVWLWAMIVLPALALAESGWSVRTPGTSADLNAITFGLVGDTPRLVAVGNGGTILTSDDEGRSWQLRGSGTSQDLLGVTATSDGGFAAVGRGGTILRSADGVAWISEPSPTTLTLTAIYDDRAVGERGVGLLTRVTESWVQSDPGFAEHAMLAVSRDRVLGEQGVRFRHLNDGSHRWVCEESGGTADLHAISHVTTYGSDDDLVIVGSEGFGVGATTETLRAVTTKFGGSINIITNVVRFRFGEHFAVGTRGVIYRRAVKADPWGEHAHPWVADPSPADADLNGVAATQHTVVAVGDGGTILLRAGTAPRITADLVLGENAEGVPYIEGQADGEGAWLPLWLQLTAGAPDPVGADYPRQSLATARFGTAGTAFRLVVVNAFGQASADIGTNRLANLSARARVENGDRALNAGFAINGPKRLAVRAIGPALRLFGVQDVLASPRLRLFRAGQEIALQVATTDGGVGAFPLPENSADRAYDVQLTESGTYNLVLDSADGGSGVALLEIYDLNPGSAFRLINLSARAWVDRGEGVLIGGVSVAGGLKRKYLLRGVGPGLGILGVNGGVTDPRLSLYQGTEAVRLAGPWSGEPDGAAIRAAAVSAHAFPLKEGSADAAMIAELREGVYTVHLFSGSGTGGLGLVELYEAP